MRLKLWVWAAVAACLWASSAWGQPGNLVEDDDDLRAQIKSLEQKLSERKKPERTGDRVTEIGGTRPRPRELQEADLVVRIYELNDLFAVAPAYFAHQPDDLGDAGRAIFGHVQGHAMGGMGGGGGFFGVSDQPRSIAEPQRPLPQLVGQDAGNLGAARTSLEDLIAAIKTTISPDEWKQGTGRGTISRLGNNLLISATEKTHDQIDALLGLFRKRWGSLRTVSLRAYWLWLTHDQLSAAIATLAGAAAAAPAPFGVVGDAEWTQLLAKAQADAEHPGYRAALTCYNGQTVSAVSGGQRRFVTDVSPTELGTTKEGAPIVSFTPTLKSVHDGAALQFTPLTTTTGKFVVLDIHTRVNRIVPNDEPKPVAKGRGDQAGSIDQIVAAIDRPSITTYQLATTLRVPVDRPILVGGMTFTGEPKANEPDLYLFVKLAVQELRDDLPSDKPADKGGDKPAANSKPPAKPDAKSETPTPTPKAKGKQGE